MNTSNSACDIQISPGLHWISVAGGNHSHTMRQMPDHFRALMRLIAAVRRRPFGAQQSMMHLSWAAALAWGAVGCGTSSDLAIVGSDGGRGHFDAGQDGAYVPDGDGTQPDSSGRPDAATSDASAEGGSDVAVACLSYAQAYCSRFLACAPVRFHTTYGDIDTCERRTTTFCPNEFLAPGTASTPDRLSACATELATRICPDVLSITPPSCVWPGSAPDGSGCEYDSQCQSGLCNKPTFSLCGSCRARFMLGETCNPLQRSCESGLVCASLATGPRCVKPGAEGEMCTSVTACVPGLNCAQSVCAKPSELNQPCLATFECNINENLTCTERGSGAQGTCVQATYAAKGESCRFADGVLCSAGAMCLDAQGRSGTVGTCGATAPDGQACDLTTPCLSPAICLNRVCKGPTPSDSCQ